MYHLAVQEDTAVTCVDWQPCHSWAAEDPDFTGRVTVLREPATRPVATADWVIPTDEVADHALRRIGWQLTAPWHTDPHGQRTAPVTRDPCPPYRN